MKYLAEFRRADAARALAREIARCLPRPVTLMEVCGGHTHAIYRYGIDRLLPPEITLLHGPGCPVCVTPLGRVDQAVALAREPGVLFATFGDMLRVPGTAGSLRDAKARGADVRVVYSPLDALRLAQENPDRQVVFFAIGFETTAPSNAMAVLRAEAAGLRNFSILSNHVRIGPALRAILDAPDVRVDGFIAPGHVSTVIGMEPYGFIPREYRRPVVISGFEPLDLLQAILMLVQQIARGEAAVENQYTRSVRPEGNPRALEAMDTVFQPCDSLWRGLGLLPRSGLCLRPAYAAFDALSRFPRVRFQEAREPKGCACGEILRGAKQPWECRLLGTACTPERPVGACMVSSEGACAAYFQYGRRAGAAAG